MKHEKVFIIFFFILFISNLAHSQQFLPDATVNFNYIEVIDAASNDVVKTGFMKAKINIYYRKEKDNNYVFFEFNNRGATLWIINYVEEVPDYGEDEETLLRLHLTDTMSGNLKISLLEYAKGSIVAYYRTIDEGRVIRFSKKN